MGGKLTLGPNYPEGEAPALSREQLRAVVNKLPSEITTLDNNGVLSELERAWRKARWLQDQRAMGLHRPDYEEREQSANGTILLAHSFISQVLNKNAAAARQPVEAARAERPGARDVLTNKIDEQVSFLLSTGRKCTAAEVRKLLTLNGTKIVISKSAFRRRVGLSINRLRKKMSR